MDNLGYSPVEDASEYFVVGVKHCERAVVTNVTRVAFLVGKLDDALLGGGGELVLGVGFVENRGEWFYY